jgi:hypothetical protein
MPRILFRLAIVAALVGGCSVAADPSSGAAAAVAVGSQTPLIIYATPAPSGTVVDGALPPVEPTVEPDPTIERDLTVEPDPAQTLAALTPLGDYASVGDWAVSITKVKWHANRDLAEVHGFYDDNEVPSGMNAVMVYVKAQYMGSGRESLDAQYLLRAVGASGVEYSTFESPNCGVMPEPNPDATVRQGAWVTGWGACWVVDLADVESLTAFVAPMWGGDVVAEFALR